MTHNRSKPATSVVSLVIIIFICLILITFLYYNLFIRTVDDDFTPYIKLTTRYSLETMRNFSANNSQALNFESSLYMGSTIPFSQIADKPFDIDGTDVLVFLHIQKTAGTSFEKFLVSHLNVTNACSCNANMKKCNCTRSSSPSIWLFSRYSTGWLCGLHADYTELFVSGCVDKALDKIEGSHTKRRFFYTTFLRNPIDRFISEYRHVERGGTWIRSRHVCRGRTPTAVELPLCFNPAIGWSGVSLDEFLSCPFNLAFNRETRMLADLSLVNCYNKSGMDEDVRNQLILASAKSNLERMAFFGIKERMNDSQLLFEDAFKMKFMGDLSNWNKSKSSDTLISTAQMRSITKLNSLDIELYKFATQLFESRLQNLLHRLS